MPRYRSSRRRGERRRSKSVFNPVSFPALLLGVGVLIYFAFQLSSDPVSKTRTSAFNRVQQQFYSQPQQPPNAPTTPHYQSQLQSQSNYPNVVPVAPHLPPPPGPPSIADLPLANAVPPVAPVVPALPPVSQQAPQPPAPLAAPAAAAPAPHVVSGVPIAPVAVPGTPVVPSAAPAAAAVVPPAAPVLPAAATNGSTSSGSAAVPAAAAPESGPVNGTTPTTPTSVAAAAPSPVAPAPIAPQYVVLDPTGPLPTKAAPPQTVLPVIKNPAPVDSNKETEGAEVVTSDDVNTAVAEGAIQEDAGNEPTSGIPSGTNETSSATEGDSAVIVDDSPGTDSNSTNSVGPEDESTTGGNETSTEGEVSIGNEATNGNDTSTVALPEEESASANNGTEASTSAEGEVSENNDKESSNEDSTPGTPAEAPAEAPSEKANTNSSSATTAKADESKAAANGTTHEEKDGIQNRDAAHSTVTVTHNKRQLRIPLGSRVTGKLPDFLGVVPSPGGMVRGQNVTRVSYALYKIVNLFGFSTMIDSPASAHLEWMSEMMQRIEFDRPMFQYYAIDPDCKALDKVRDAIGIIGSAIYKCTGYIPEETGADVLFYWPELEEIADVKEFRKKLESKMKKAKFAGINYIIVPQYPAVKDRKVIYTYGRWKLEGDDDGTLPFLLNEFLRGIVPVQQPTEGNPYLLYMTFYALKPLPFY